MSGQRRWVDKFADAGRGILAGMQGQSSFVVHLPAALFVLIAAGYFQVAAWEWCLLVLTIALVLTAELGNSALECLAKAITTEQNTTVGRALDIASGAVLVAATGAVVVGVIIFGPRLWNLIL